jgi:outer membrane receptor protein involved in Fe transport
VLEFTGTAFTTFNVPKANTRGVEIEGLIRPNSELTFNLGATFLKADYPDDCDVGQENVVTVASLCGNPLTNAPQVIALLGGMWEKPISDSVEFFLAGQVRMESDQRTSTQAIVPPTVPPGSSAATVQAAVDAAPRIVADIQDGKAFVNLRAGLRFADGAYAIEGWVNNLTDEVVRGVTFNTTLRGSGINNSRSAFTLPPRQYGVTLRARF